MKVILKRVCAYLIDIILVSLVATVISSNAQINKDYKKYEKVYSEYTNKYEEYNKYYTKLENYYENKKISEKEYNKLLEYNQSYTKDLVNYYEDKTIDKEEYEIIIENINVEYSKMEEDYSYRLLKYSTIPTIIVLLFTLLYFVVFQYYLGGQTLGKKLMKLKVVSNSDKKLSILNFLFRSLIVNEVIINTISIICLVTLSKNGYIAYNKIIYVITYILEMTILFMVVFDKNNRGLHDYVGGTKVIEDKKE